MDCGALQKNLQKSVARGGGSARNAYVSAVAGKKHQHNTTMNSIEIKSRVATLRAEQDKISAKIKNGTVDPVAGTNTFLKLQKEIRLLLK